MNALIAIVMFVLTGANTHLTCVDASVALPQSNHDRVLFVVNNTEYVAKLDQTSDGIDSYSVEFESTLAAGKHTLRQVIVDGEHVNITDPKSVTCEQENDGDGKPTKHVLFLPIVRK